MLTINKHVNFCCFKALAYTTLDRLWLFYIIAVSIKFLGSRGMTNSNLDNSTNS